MKRAILFAGLTLMAVGLMQVRSPRVEARGLAQYQGNQPRAGVCFYADTDYRGESFCVNAGESLANVGGRYNDKISSVRVFGGVRVVVFEHGNFEGAGRTITGDVPNLGDWNDRISSFQASGARQYQGRYGGQHGAVGSASQASPGVCFFMDANYGGESYCVSAGESQAYLGDHFNDKVSSIRVFGGVQVVLYEDENFRGASLTIAGDMPGLGDWNDKVSSFQVLGRQGQARYGGQYGTVGSGNEPLVGACFYVDRQFQGARFCVNTGEGLETVGSRFNDQISSIRVFGGAQVVVYENERFSGSRQRFSVDVASLGDWNDKITSVLVSGGRQIQTQYGGQHGAGLTGYEPTHGACFYVDVDYRGESFCLEAGEATENLEGRYNDKISSIRVFGGARVTVYQNRDYQGAHRTITGNVANLGEFHDQVSSVRVR